MTRHMGRHWPKALLTVMVFVAAVGILTVPGEAFHPCEDLVCTDQADCGSGSQPPCFCNNPNACQGCGRCYPNGV